MLKLLRLLFATSCLILPILTGCTASLSEKEAAFQNILTATDVNTSIVLKPIPNIQNAFEVRNQTSYSIALPKNLGLKLYIYDDNQKAWVEIGDDMVTVNKDNIVIPPKDDQGLLSRLPIQYQPDIGNHQPPATIRALLVGKIIQNGVESDQEVAAFTDVPFGK